MAAFRHARHAPGQGIPHLQRSGPVSQRRQIIDLQDATDTGNAQDG
jgi:hypothetical protein